MADLKSLEFEERAHQWFINEIYGDGSTKPGEPFMASGHEHFTKLEQVLRRIQDKYPTYRPTHVPYDQVDRKHYSFELVLKEVE